LDTSEDLQIFIFDFKQRNMKILLTKTLAVIAAMTLTFAANAQTDYVITVKGDSIPCTISTSFKGKDSYKVNATSESKKIKPNEIREYCIARKNLHEQSVYADGNTQPVFMIVIEKGPISLYRTVPFSKKSTTKWFIGKGSDQVNGLKTRGLFLLKSREERRDLFAETLKDNKDVYARYIAEDKFSFK